MTEAVQTKRRWRVLRHPLRMGLRGWKAGRRCLISPRGTVFETAVRPGMVLARRRRVWELSEN